MTGQARPARTIPATGTTHRALTLHAACAKWLSAMKNALPLTAVAALLALAACNSKPAAPEVLDSNPDPMANTLANAAPVELPPAIKSEQTLRCKDNSLVYVTFFQGEKQAVVRTKEGGPATTLKTPEAGKPLVADGGWSMTGSEKSITLAQPGKPSQTCHT